MGHGLVKRSSDGGRAGGQARAQDSVSLLTEASSYCHLPVSVLSASGAGSELPGWSHPLKVVSRRLGGWFISSRKGR